MKFVAAIVLLSSGVAFADPFPEDKPLSADVSSGLIGLKVTDPGDYEQFEVTGGQYYNNKGVEKLDAAIADMQRQIAGLKAENASLKLRTDQVAAEPSIQIGNRWLAAVVIIGTVLSAGLLVVTLVKK